MPDRAGLKIVGFIFALVTAAVMLTTVQVIKSYADAELTLESASRVADSSR
jgi:hypothetical protein